MANRKKKNDALATSTGRDYQGLLSGVAGLLEQSRQSVARVVNVVLAATYWELGKRIVEFEQGGKTHADYGQERIKRLSTDLSKKYGRGFSRQNLQQMRTFYVGWEICQTVSGISQARAKCTDAAIGQVATLHSTQPIPLLENPARIADLFPLSWSHYVRLMTVPNFKARRFYEDEAITGGWSVRQLDRQIATQFYERLGSSNRKEGLLAKAHVPEPADALTPDELVRDPYVLEFLNLADEYGESDLEEAIVRNLETFLLELGRGFTFVARQRKIRIDAEWYKIDLLLFHRRLRCLVVIDLKIGKFSHADAGQMNLYLNYAKEHLVEPGENTPIGLILCSQKSDTVVRYAMGGINAQVFASQYLSELPTEEDLREAIERTKKRLLHEMK